jgi:hypothetical protein
MFEAAKDLFINPRGTVLTQQDKINFWDALHS